MFQVASCDCPGTSIAPGPPHSSLLPTLMALLTSGEFKILSSQVSTIVCFYPSCSFMSYPTENRRIYISLVLIDTIPPSVALLPCLMTNVALYAQERGQNWKIFLNSKSWWTSLISVDSPAYGCLEANPSGREIYPLVCLDPSIKSSPCSSVKCRLSVERTPETHVCLRKWWTQGWSGMEGMERQWARCDLGKLKVRKWRRWGGTLKILERQNEPWSKC